MGFLRLGTRVAVINDKNEILLSKRGDFATWALPGGRLDNHELIQDCAVREVREETGLEVEIVRPVGLYYQQGRSRMDIVYRAKPIGGELFKASDETLDNRFFSPDALPEPLFGYLLIEHAYSNKTFVHTVETPAWTLFKLDMQLRWRWIMNLLAGRPEPKFPQFTVRAVGIVRNSGKVLTLDGKLPTITSDGNQSLSDALSREVQKAFSQKLEWSWVGLQQDTSSDSMDFIFEASANIRKTEWTSPNELSDTQKPYLKIQNIALFKYESMRNKGASPLEIGQELYKDSVSGIDFYKIMRAVFVNLTLSEVKEISILSSGSTIDEWAKSVIDGIEQALDDELNSGES